MSSRALFFIIAICCVPAVVSQTPIDVKRRPLEMVEFEITSPAPYALRLRRDSAQTEPIEFDPELSIRRVDEGSGRYFLEWRGSGGERKRMEYVRPDTVEVVVAASVGPGTLKKYRYHYELRNSKNSAQYMSGFFIQTLASDVIAKPMKENAYVGHMGKHIPQFSHGTWVSFGKSNFGDEVQPGVISSVWIESDSPPGPVYCRVHGGPMKMIGIGEELPLEIGDVLPGYESWPIGITIGPSEEFAGLEFEDRVHYLDKWFNAITLLGWAKPSVIGQYRQATNRAEITAPDFRVLQDQLETHSSPELNALIGVLIGGSSYSP